MAVRSSNIVAARGTRAKPPHMPSLTDKPAHPTIQRSPTRSEPPWAREVWTR